MLALLSARERHDLFEATLTMLSLIELDRLEGVEPPLEMVNESRSLLSQPQGSGRPTRAASGTLVPVNREAAPRGRSHLLRGSTKLPWPDCT